MERLFSEIYNRYFRIVGLLLAKRGTISPGMLRDTVQKYGFGESMLFLLPGLSQNRWGLFEETEGGLRSKIPGGVSMPLSRLQMRWLKAVLKDPRACLFLEADQQRAIEETLADAAPLFHYEDFRYFDRFSDGDDYTDKAYRRHFRVIKNAIYHKQLLRIRYEARAGRITRLTVRPRYLEYSVKNDCFRLLCEATGKSRIREYILRISRMKSVEVSGTGPAPDTVGDRSLAGYGIGIRAQSDIKKEPFTEEKTQEKVTLVIRDQRNAVERVMLQFTGYRKNTLRLEDDSYRCEIFYDKDDETELLIEILSFGPAVRVIGNEHFIRLVKERLQRQKALAECRGGST